MDSKKINALLTIVDSGSLTSASEKLGYTQPGLTNMMKALEDEMGLTLLIRGKTGVRLSPIGHELRADMEEFLKASEKLAANAELIRKKNQSTFRVGAIASVARNWLPTILSEYKSTYPDTDIFVTRHDVLRSTYEAVRSGDLDCAIISYQEQMAAGLFWYPLHKDELVAVLPVNYPVNDNVFHIEDFYYSDFLMPSGGLDLDILPIFESYGSRRTPNIHYSNLDDASVLSMVSHGLGVSIMSKLIVQGLNENVKTLPLEPTAYREIGIVVRERSAQDKNIRNFTNCIIQALANIDEPRG